MNPQRPWLSPEVLDQIRLVAEAEGTNEACGVVTPDSMVVKLPNASPSPTMSYEIRSVDLVEAVCTYADRSGVEIEGLDRSFFIIWHTHPSGFVGPSRRDMQTRLPGFQYAVISLPGGEVVKF